VSDEVLNYFQYRNVTAKFMNFIGCTYKDVSEGGAIFKKTVCADPFPDIKMRWSRFPLARDWLMECNTCTGPVLVMDVDASFFQLDPFGENSPVVKGLQVFEEHESHRTTNWLTNTPFTGCKGTSMDRSMISSGSVVGTRAAMLKYLEVMYEEMKVWIRDPKCRFNFEGDEQAIHNWLYYTGQIPFATSFSYRRGGIVTSVGVEGAKMAKQHREKMMKKHKVGYSDAMNMAYDGARRGRWIGKSYGITDDKGFFTENDGARSRVVQQFDRFGKPFVERWLRRQSFISDSIPKQFKFSKLVRPLKQVTKSDTNGDATPKLGGESTSKFKAHVYAHGRIFARVYGDSVDKIRESLQSIKGLQLINCSVNYCTVYSPPDPLIAVSSLDVVTRVEPMGDLKARAT
jgi:hypothetical protein